MKIETSGVALRGVCDVQTSVCLAPIEGPITTVWELPERVQVNVCKPCLEKQVREGEWEIPGARIPPRFDLAVYDASGRLALAVEIKPTSTPTHTENQWARRVRRNLLAHAALPPDAPFLLVTDRGHSFFWAPAGTDEPEREPDLKFDLELQPLGKSNSTADRAAVLEQAVAQWLEQFVHPSDGVAQTVATHRLASAGLLHAIRGGRVVRQQTLAR